MLAWSFAKLGHVEGSTTEAVMAALAESARDQVEERRAMKPRMFSMRKPQEKWEKHREMVV